MQESKECKKNTATTTTTNSSDDLMRKMKQMVQKKIKKPTIGKLDEENISVRPMHLLLHELKQNHDKILLYNSPETMVAYYADNKGGLDKLSTYLSLKHSQPLWDFQETAVDFIHEREQDKSNIGQHGALLCDEMGMGKSKVVLTVILESSQKRCHETGERFGNPTLVVCTDILISNWITEIKSFPKYAFEYMDMTEKKMRHTDLFYFEHACDIVFTTYTTVANAFKNQSGDEFNIIYRTKWGRIVADEGHQIVTATTLVARAMIDIIAKCKLVLTGTPVQNKEKDIWALLQFIGVNESSPQQEDRLNYWLKHLMIRRKLKQFEGIGNHMPQRNNVHHHVELLEFSTLQEKCLYYTYAKYALDCRHKKSGVILTNIPPLIQLLRQLCIGPHAIGQIVVPNGILLLNQVIDRHPPTKSTPAIRSYVSNLKPTREYHYSEGLAYKKNKNIYNNALLDDHYIQSFSSEKPFTPLTKQEHAIYNEFKNSGGEVTEKMCHYGTLEEIKSILSRIMSSTINLNWPSTKEKAIISIIRRLKKGQKVVIFAAFASTLNHLSRQLEYHGYKSVIVSGEQSRTTNVSNIGESRDNPEVIVLLMSLKIGNAGLNINWIDVVIFLDLWWNPQIHNQAERRVDRPGRQKDIHIYYLIMDHTIELYIMNLLTKKKKIAEFLDHDVKHGEEEGGEIIEGGEGEENESSEDLTLNKMGLTEEEACKLFDYDITFD